VAIARALVQSPEMMLADEPIASLDPHSAIMVMDALRRINREDGITVLCNLHTLDTARKYCDRIIGIAAGEVIFDGEPSALDDVIVRRIYGVANGDNRFDESATSTTAFGNVPHLVPIPA
jgi:phosphonate transport system ATP-binding protein